ncbi:hypothetical protein FRC03_003940 [Tulasnella sp. 419]|nr:hypothetical protein FRC03_003940 [Tulasnella sp. 419]
MAALFKQPSRIDGHDVRWGQIEIDKTENNWMKPNDRWVPIHAALGRTAVPLLLANREHGLNSSSIPSSPKPTPIQPQKVFLIAFTTRQKRGTHKIKQGRQRNSTCQRPLIVI